MLVHLGSDGMNGGKKVNRCITIGGAEPTNLARNSRHSHLHTPLSFIEVVRWLLVLPVAVSASLFIQVILYLFLGDINHPVMTGGGTFAYLIVAMDIAPKYKMPSGIILALGSCFVGFTSIDSPPIGSSEKFIATICACLLAFVFDYIFSKSRLRTIPRLNAEAKSAAPEHKAKLLEKLRPLCDRKSELYYKTNLQLAEIHRLASRWVPAEELAQETATTVAFSNLEEKRVTRIKQEALREIARIYRDQRRYADSERAYLNALNFLASSSATPHDAASLSKEANEVAARVNTNQ